MTGYGKATGKIGENAVTVEIKSLNGKSFELGLRIPSSCREKELEIRNLLLQEIQRGRAEASLQIDNGNDSKKGSLNKKFIRSFIHELKLLERDLKLPPADYLNTVLALPNAMGSEKQEITEKEWKQIEQMIRKAAKAFQSFRIAEGKSLEKDLFLRIKSINRCLAEIEKFEPARLTAIKSRLSKMLSGIDDAAIDKNRFEQELIYYLEKIDITEEKIRLKTHCDYFLNTMTENEANGKKLGFIIQEIGREINTIGSKANDASIQRLVVEMKDELEKMKEQVANIL